MGTRGANRDAMVQHLEDDAWVDTLISEAYADAWAGRTSAHHTRKHVNRRMRTLFHVGADDDRPEGFDTATLFSFDDVDGSSLWASPTLSMLRASSRCTRR